MKPSKASSGAGSSAGQGILPEQIEKEVAEGKRYKNGLNLFETVKRNERFYLGEQWDGLKVRALRPVTMNFLRRTCAYFQSMILSDDIGYDIRPFLDTQDADTIASIYEREIDRVVERTKLKQKNRDSLRDMVVDGDAVKYFYFDPDIENGQAVKGEICAENLMNTNVIFGNPYTSEVQNQPYIIIQRRRPVRVVREEAKALGAQGWECIEAEDDSDFVGGDDMPDSVQCTENTRFWKKDGKVWFMRACGKVAIKRATETPMTLYPIAYMSWEERKNACHGVSPITEVINTQIAVNQMWTAVNVFIQTTAFPKLVYDNAKFPNGWDGRPGKAVAVNGDVREAVTSVAGGINLPAAIVQIMDQIVSTTRDFMGANDAALGNVKPDNTSAIIAVQKASSAPLEMKRLHFYQFIEDCIRIIVDMMSAYYGKRVVKAKVQRQPAMGTVPEPQAPRGAIPQGAGGVPQVGSMPVQMPAPEPAEQEILFDFSGHPLHALEINVEVGQASYWSELIAVQTADNLLVKGVYSDITQYLEALPDNLVPNKAALMRALREQAQKSAMQPQGIKPGAAAGMAGIMQGKP